MVVPNVFALFPLFVLRSPHESAFSLKSYSTLLGKSMHGSPFLDFSFRCAPGNGLCMLLLLMSAPVLKCILKS